MAEYPKSTVLSVTPQSLVSISPSSFIKVSAVNHTECFTKLSVHRIAEPTFHRAYPAIKQLEPSL
jgi:hypothetical protein